MSEVIALPPRLRVIDCRNEQPNRLMQRPLQGSVQIEALLEKYEASWCDYSASEKAVRRTSMRRALIHSGFL